jgi:hypothetical protein
MKKLTLLLAVCVMAMAATPAFGQPGQDGYQNGGENTAGQIQGGGGGGDDAPAGTVAAGAQGGSLPFTGLDLALIFAVGGVLLTVGLGTRRLTRHNAA